jgi:hypothetical protein
MPVIKKITNPVSFLSFKNTAKNPFQPGEKASTGWPANWMTDAQENITKSEYYFKQEERFGSYSTPNRKQNLRFYYTEKGFSAEPRTTRVPVGKFDPTKPPAENTYRNIPRWKIKFDLDRKQVADGTWQIAKEKASYISRNITVQYINNEKGMRQNFIVHNRVSPNKGLRLNFSVRTNLKARLKNDRLQFFHKRTNVLNYDQLMVWDATGRILEAAFEKTAYKKYCIKVADRDAVYPITIDPISSTPAVTLESNQVNANLGFSVSSAGDVNGDGYSDLIAGAPAYDNGQTDEGAAFVFHGSATGINPVPAVILEGNQVNARMGVAVSTAGDVNNDGYSDIIVGANLYDNGETDEGAAFVFHGSATGINTVAVTMVQSDQALAQMGFSVACAGDVNGDGYSDVIVGAWLYSNSEGAEGRAYVYQGSASGINSAAVTTMESNQVNANLGIAVAGAGDVNGDGFSDVIVGSQLYDNGTTDEGVAFVYHGSPSGINSIAVTTLESNQGFSQFGFSVASAGDVNGDGYSDVIVGAYTYDDPEVNEGAAFVYHGSAAGINNIAATTLENNQAGAQFGVSVACAGDVNGDGYSDVIAGANMYDNVESNEGAAYVHLGSAAGINSIATAVLESNQANANAGRAVASAGDVNGDGYSDVLSGVPQFDNTESNEGVAFVYHGSAAGINTVFTTMTDPNQVAASMGYSVAGAGDVNADGYSDVIVGVPYYDNGQTDEGVAFVYHGSATGINPVAAILIESNQASASLGYSVASAGDLNGDGYSDVIIGAPFFDNGQSDEGRALVYLGSATGINNIAAATVESNQPSAYFGHAVASAGDVNGDGYSDVVVGAYRYDNPQLDEGAAFVYHGSPTGLNTTVAALVESNQVNAYMGYFVAGAGSVNGDSFGDIVVGAPLYDNGQADEGAAFVYHGSATGINIVPAAILEPDQVDARMGFSVSGAGDVNGDGYGDVIVGSYSFDNVEVDEGAAFIYHGSAGGIITTPANILESNQANAYAGFAVSNAGDVNGDGYSDVIVGAYNFDNPEMNEGVAFIYHGSLAGINPAVAATLESNQVNAVLGYAVASAGDVNADGYSDVIAGAYGFDNGQANEGAAFVYQGNSPGTNKRNNLRLYNSNLVTPINSGSFITGNFGAGIYAKSFLGRAKGKMVWETRLNYNAYSGSPITNSTFFTTQQSSYTDLGLTGVELKNVIAKILAGGRYTKLRARVKYDPVTSLTGQVYGPWRNVSGVIDGNSLGALPIDLVSFKASWLQKGKTAKLELVTDKETGICCFEIEKSTNGFDYASIGSLTANNTGGIQHYSFIDQNARDKNQYYRIRITGPGGKIEYSNIQQLQYNASTKILVFPNPTTDVLHVRLNSVYDKITASIFNSSGQLVKQLQFTSSQLISIPVQTLPRGQYWLHLQSRDEKQVLQFARQ